MAKTIKRKKIIILKLEINQLERNKTFEVKLPANVKNITEVIITTSLKS